MAIIRLGAPGGTLGAWQVDVAARKGFFQAQGVAVDRGQEPAGRLIEALAGGSRDIILAPADDVVRAAAGGQAVVMVGGAVNRAAFTLVAARDVVDVAGLKGKLVGVRDSGDITAALARAVLSARGLGDADYRLVSFEDAAVRAAAVANGTVGASLLDAGRAARLEASGFRALAQAYETVPELQAEALAVQADWARQNEDRLVRFLRAIAQADRWIYDPQNRPEAVDVLAGVVGLTAAEADRIYERYVEQQPAIPKAAELEQPGVRSVVDLLAAIEGLRPPLPDLAVLVNTSYVQRAR